MFDLFRGTVDVLLLLVVASLAASAAGHARKTDAAPRLSDATHEEHSPQPGSGTTAVISLETGVGMIEINGRNVSFPELIRSNAYPDKVVLRLKGADWRNLATLIKSRDLRFAVETDP
jgi:hypothetical protein